MPKEDWQRKDKYHIKHKRHDATISIYSDCVLLWVGDQCELFNKVSGAIEYYDGKNT